jgi:hypothetical protein
MSFSVIKNLDMWSFQMQQNFQIWEVG